MPTKSWPSRWLTRSVGFSTCLLILTTACASRPLSTDEPYYCEPFRADPHRVEQYRDLMSRDLAPKVRAWVREADRVCRANNALRSPE